MKDWQIRNAREDDLPFIYQTWLNSYGGDSVIGKSVRRSVYQREYKRVINKILFDASTIVAHKPDDDVVIYGYLVFDYSILHYCFVKEAFRFSGIAKDLVIKAHGKNVLPCFYTHHTKHLQPIVEKYSLLTYNPFILFKEVGDK